MTNQIKSLDRKYIDHRCIIVHVVGYDAENNQVIYMREGYEHQCSKSVKRFRKEFTKVAL